MQFTRRKIFLIIAVVLLVIAVAVAAFAPDSSAATGWRPLTSYYL